MVSNVFKTIGWFIIVILSLIGVLASLGQIPPGQDSYNDGFEQYPIITLLHVIPGIVFMVLGPMQFIPLIRRKLLNIHRWAGRIFLINAVFIGFSGILMAILFPFAGLFEQLAILFFGPLFLISIFMAYINIRRFEIEKHREWMIRVFSIGLGIGMIRVFLGIFVGVYGFEQITVFPWTFWLGFGSCWLTGEFWIWYTRLDSKHNTSEAKAKV